MISLLRHRNYALLWSAGTVSLLGDWILMIALPFYVYHLTDSALATGFALMTQVLPRVLLGSLAGVFVDRWDRKRTLVLADLARGGLLLPLLLVQSVNLVWVIYLVGLLQAAIGQFFIPAKSAYLPRLVSEPELVNANALTSLSDNLTRLIGPALGGALYGLIGLPVIVVLDSASFLISAALIGLIGVSGRPLTTATKSSTNPFSAVWQEWQAGLQTVRASRILSTLFIVLGIAMIGEGLITALMVPFTTTILGVGATELGILLSAQAIGGLLGGLLIGPITQRFNPLRLIALGGLLDGLLLITIFLSRSFTVALVLIMLAGLPAVAFYVSMQTLVQQHTVDQYRGRVFGAFGTVAATVTLLGMALAGVLAGPLGIVLTMSLAGLANLLAGGVALLASPLLASTPPTTTEQLPAVS